ncbi:MAG TPA: methyltransferase [Blastocatellia bacterium]|nr:methyltransferase [Blastocatellia bacterium]
MSTTAQTAQALPPEAVLTQMAFGPLLSQSLSVAAKLGIADLLAEKPKAVADLAAATKTNEQALYRVLRALASVGVFTETEGKVFALTPLAEPLRADVPNSVRNGVIFAGADWHWRVWSDLEYSVRTGLPAWGHTHGAEVFDYFAIHPAESEIFNNAMTDMSVAIAPSVVAAYDFTPFATIADIAGGHGYLLSQILRAAPASKGILFDLPHVLARADIVLEQQGVSERVEKVAGDFFQAVPRADAYVMKYIIHDWDDARALRILRVIHQAMDDNAKLLIVETVIPEGNEPHPGKLFDVEMLVSPGGIERTEKEFAALLAEAGFKMRRIIPAQFGLSIVEAEKA